MHECLVISPSSNISVGVQREKALGFDGQAEPGLKTDLMPVLQTHFRTEFINRIDEVIAFRSLAASEIKTILKLILDEIANSLSANHGKTVRFTDEAVAALMAEGYSAEFGVRHLRRTVQRLVEIPLSKLILSGDLANSHDLVVNVENGQVVSRPNSD